MTPHGDVATSSNCQTFTIEDEQFLSQIRIDYVDGSHISALKLTKKVKNTGVETPITIG